MSSINIVIDERYYSKDPFSSDLGKRIIEEGLSMIDELGFELFTFKKLAERIGSTEASVYRYFENKQKLLIYLMAWYWSWADYQIDYETYHLRDANARMSRAWEVLCHLDIPLENVSMNVSTLRRIVIKESDKTYLTKNVDAINKEGLFLDFKSLCHKLAQMLTDLKSDYQFSHTLVSTLLEASHQQNYFAQHLPALTEVKNQSEEEVNKQVHEFIMDTLSRVLASDKETTIA